jgi:2-hydroxychromene-2-carboxylate isomerase
MTQSFAVTFDYRCPFARNAHEAVVTGLRENRDWDVRFLPFSLDQVHVEEGQPPVWDRPPAERGTGVLALQWGIAVRDRFFDQFYDFHVELFAARHDHALKLGHEDVIRDVAAKVGLDVEAVAAEVESGRPLKTLAEEHTEAVKDWDVFGVPTFIDGTSAVFIRFMERDRADDVDRALELLPWTRLNEYKHTRIPR